jgi:hypothetical protein
MMLVFRTEEKGYCGLSALEVIRGTLINDFHNFKYPPQTAAVQISQSPVHLRFLLKCVSVRSQASLAASAS